MKRLELERNLKLWNDSIRKLKVHNRNDINGNRNFLGTFSACIFSYKKIFQKN